MLKRFSEITMSDVSICGGKGASLGEMMNVGLPIPNGFVLTTNAYGTDSKEWEKEVLDAFDKLNTKFVAVRSSGTKEDGADDSFAGQFDTYLFVTRENLIEKIKECHDSVNSDRITTYCNSKGIDQKAIKVAAVVQKMVNSDSAGVCFTANPVSGGKYEVMIEAGLGVGEAVVSGMITPDNYIVDKNTLNIEKEISQQEKKLVLSDKGGTKEIDVLEEEQEAQKLSDQHILELAELAKKIENHYGKPMDIEWAVEKGKLFILQARPITTELKYNINDKVAAERKSEDWFLMEEVKGARPFLLSGRGRKLTERYDKEFNLPIEDVMVYKDNTLFLYVKHHQLYLTAEAMLQKSLSDVNFLSSISQRNRKIQNETFAFCDELEKDNLKEKTDQELMQLFAKYMEQLEIMITIGRVDCILEFENEMFSTTLRNYLAKTIKEKGLQLNVAEVFSTFTIPVEKTRGILQEESLQAIADKVKKDEKALNFFLENSPETIENNIEAMFPIINTKLEEHTKEFNWYFYMYEGPARNKLNFISELKQLLSSKQPAQTENVNLVEAKAELIKKLDINDDYQKLLKSAEEMVFNKDLRKHALYRMSYVGINIFKEVAQRCNISVEEAWNLTPREIQDLTLDDIKNLDLKSRDKGMIMCFYKGGHETDLDSNNANKFMEDVSEKNKLTGNITTLQGSCAYQGKIVGKVMIVDSPEDMKKFKEGEILVAHQTDPDILPAMKLAAAFVTDLGGITCHAAIVSREMKKPCIVGTKIATQVLKDGDLVEVDADSGIVKVLENENKGEGNLKQKKVEDRIANISNKNWKKNREGNRSILSSYYFGLDYTVKATENIGIGFKETLFISQKGRTVSYILPEHKQKFGLYFQNKLYQDETLIKTRYNNAKSTTNEILETIAKLKNLPINKENFEIFLKILYKYGGRQRIMKHASDYWDASFIDKNIKYLEKGRLLGEGVYVETENYMKYVCETLGNKYGIKTELIQAMTKEQFENLLYNGIITDKKTLQDQFENFAFYISDTDFLSTYEKQQINNIKEILKNNKRINSNIIQGNKAYGGKVKGKVRIILHPEKNPKFEKGDILVTGMTRPEYLPYVKKSAAVVTDAGGLLCHAAILAREIEKPCIVGTEIATQVLKDGDIVEIDADNGVIKIL